jgi:hypothetical protein
MNLSPTAIPWYSPEAYPEIVRLISPDGNQAMSYDEWVDRMVQLEGDLRLVGRLPVRVDVEPDALTSWCRETQRKLDAQAIGDFAAQRMAAERTAK